MASDDAPIRDDWSLEDGEVVHAAHPRSFFIPPREHRADVRTGEDVKLSFVAGDDPAKASDENAEQLWVRVVEVTGRGAYRGELLESPQLADDLAAVLSDGDLVNFEARHVIGLSYSADELGYDPEAWAIVDRRILDHDEAPEALTFAEPVGIDEIDGKLWFAALDQSSPDESGWAKLGELVDRWPPLAEVFQSRGGMWRREKSGGQYRVV